MVMRTRRSGLPLLVPKLRRVNVFQPQGGRISTAAKIQELDCSFFWLKPLMAKRFEEAPNPLHARIMSEEQPKERRVMKDSE